MFQLKRILLFFIKFHELHTKLSAGSSTLGKGQSRALALSLKVVQANYVKCLAAKIFTTSL